MVYIRRVYAALGMSDPFNQRFSALVSIQFLFDSAEPILARRKPELYGILSRWMSSHSRGNL